MREPASGGVRVRGRCLVVYEDKYMTAYADAYMLVYVEGGVIANARHLKWLDNVSSLSNTNTYIYVFPLALALSVIINQKNYDEQKSL